jgi:hypothetical protein
MPAPRRRPGGGSSTRDRTARSGGRLRPAGRRCGCRRSSSSARFKDGWARVARSARSHALRSRRTRRPACRAAVGGRAAAAHALRRQRADHQRIDHAASDRRMRWPTRSSARPDRPHAAGRSLRPRTPLPPAPRMRREAVAVDHRGAEHRVLEGHAQFGSAGIQRQRDERAAAAMVGEAKLAGGALAARSSPSPAATHAVAMKAATARRRWITSGRPFP